MQRRSFFRSLAMLTGAASLSPNIFIPKFEPVKWKSNRGLTQDMLDGFARDMMVFNPANFYGEWSFVTVGVEAWNDLLKPSLYPINAGNTIRL